MDSVNMALTIHAVYHYVIESFGDLAAEEKVFWCFFFFLFCLFTCVLTSFSCTQELPGEDLNFPLLTGDSDP